MAAPALVTLLFDALIEADVNQPAMTARRMAAELAHKVIVIDPDELHVMDIKPDGTWMMGHPASCQPDVFGCLFATLAQAGFEAPHPGRWTVVIEDQKIKPTGLMS